ncbi:MAG TPA: restriction endonuclease [Saprospiraceae bacterium]|nr:restriction endonuclease [Saprospiraceae bacterium]
MKDNPLKRIYNAQQFEELCCEIAQFKYGDFDAQKFGRSGQKQWGVDIKATYKKAKGEKIVIQCKFKEKHEEFKNNKKAIQNEILSELTQAIEGNSFDYFVYASNIHRDTSLQKFADSLSTDDYKVIVWSQQDIEDDIYRYERLKQNYTLNGIKHGVDIINTDFIDTLREEEKASKPNIFRYYTSSEVNNVQWYGILNEWDVKRNDLFNFIKNINESFSNEFIESRVGGIILGEGGSGKSVFLRRIAFEICVNQKDIVTWWVTDLHSFYSRDVNIIDDNPHYKHLVIIEDWYRNVGKDYSYSEPIFSWLKKKNNVRVIIGDRTLNNGYRKHITSRNKFLISLDENVKILETIKDKLPEPDLKNSISKLLENKALISNSPIFIILYVLSELIENELDIAYDKMNFENIFKELIGKKIASLEGDTRYKGLGKGLYVFAVLYSVKYSNYVSISENAFLHISEFLGENNEISQRIKSNGKYPELFDSLVSFNEINYKSGFLENRLSFNHDLLAEKGISLIQETKYALDFNFDQYEVKKLIDLCLNRGESNLALTLFLWLNNNFGDVSTITFFQFFTGNLEKISENGLYSYLMSLSKEQRSLFTKEMLEQKNFFKLQHQIVSHSLQIWQNEKLGKDKAKEILEQKDFFQLPHQIVSNSLRIWQNDKLGKDKAKEILEQKDFFKLPSQIVSHSLRIWQNDKIGKDKSKEILDQKDFFKLPFEIVSYSLRIWQNDKLGKDKAKEILDLLINNKDVNTFLIFSSLRVFCIQESKEKIVELVYSKINSIRKQKNYGKLYYDLLYLPLFHIGQHRKRVLDIIENYSYNSGLSQKRNLFFILNCFKEYPNERQHNFDIEELICNINLNWLQDLEYQKKISPTEIHDSHIALSISNIHSKSESKKIASRIVEYCKGNTLLTQQKLYNAATEILNNDEFEFWE